MHDERHHLNGSELLSSVLAPGVFDHFGYWPGLRSAQTLDHLKSLRAVAALVPPQNQIVPSETRHSRKTNTGASKIRRKFTTSSALPVWMRKLRRARRFYRVKFFVEVRCVCRNRARWNGDRFFFYSSFLIDGASMRYFFTPATFDSTTNNYLRRKRPQYSCADALVRPVAIFPFFLSCFVEILRLFAPDCFVWGIVDDGSKNSSILSSLRPRRAVCLDNEACTWSLA